MRHITTAKSRAGSAIVLVLIAYSLISGCSTQSTPPSSENVTTVNVVVKNFLIGMDKTSIPPGWVKFVIKNEGPDQHEFVVFKTDLDPSNLPIQGYQKQVNEDAPELTHIGEHDYFPAGETVTLVLQLDAGSYAGICNLPGHYVMGMRMGFTVTETPEAPPPNPSPPSGATTVNATLKDFTVMLDRTTIPAGTVAFKITNQGPSEHEFVVFRSDLPAAGLPQKMGQVIEDAPGVTHIDEQQQFAAQQTATLVVQLDPGKYIALCNLPGHYAAGMRIGFTVE